MIPGDLWCPHPCREWPGAYGVARGCGGPLLELGGSEINKQTNDNYKKMMVMVTAMELEME